MRNDSRARAVLLLGVVLAAAGCSTTQPDTLGTRTASISILVRAEVTVFNCYEIWADDADGNPAYAFFNECYPELNEQNNQVVSERNIPWHYSLSVTIIHPGTTNETVATSLSGVIGSSIQQGDGIDDVVSMSPYDPTDQPADFKAPEVRPGFGIVQFLNGKQVSRGHPFWLSTNGFELGEANILTESPTFDFEVNSGDTVVVRARKQFVADAAHFLQALPPPQITMSATLSVGGALVSPAGLTSSTDADGAGMTFSFAVQ